MCFTIAALATGTAPNPYSQCFTDTERAGILSEIGQVSSKRADPYTNLVPPIRIGSEDYLAGGLSGQVANIILSELMGYKGNITFVPNNQTEMALIKGIANRDIDVNFEVWVRDPTTSAAYQIYVQDYLEVIDASQLGVIAQHGFYIPSYLQSQDNEYLDFWRAYVDPQSTVYDILDKSLRVNESYYVSPRFVPPQCQTDESRCVEMVGIEPEMAGNISKVIVTNGMMVMIAWCGDSVNEIVNDRLANQQPILFHYFSPAGFLTDHTANLTRISLPTYTGECARNNTKVTEGQTVYCDFPPIAVRKLFNSQLKTDALYVDADNMINAFFLNNNDQDWMFHAFNASIAAEYGLDAACYKAACDWLKYEQHVRNSPLQLPSATALDDGKQGVPPIILPPRWYSYIFNTPHEHVIPLDEAYVMASTIAAGVLAFLSLVLQITLGCYRRHPVVKASTHTLCQAMVMGSYLCYASVVVAGHAREDAMHCIVYPTLFGMGYVLLLGALALKNWRIHVIFKGISKAPPPSNSKLMTYLLGLLACEVIFNCVWFLLNRPTLVLVSSTVLDSTALELVCSFDSNPLIQVAFFSPKLLLLLWACYVGFRVRNVTHNFNESTKVALATFAIMLEFLFGMILSKVLLNPSMQFILQGFLVCFGTFNVLVILFVPKLCNIYVLSRRGFSSLRESMLTHSVHHSDESQNHMKLMRKVATQQQEINRLRNLLREVEAPSNLLILPDYDDEPSETPVPGGGRRPRQSSLSMFSAVNPPTSIPPLPSTVFTHQRNRESMASSLTDRHQHQHQQPPPPPSRGPPQQ